MDNNRNKALVGFVILAAVLGLASWRLLAPVTHAGSCDLSSHPCPVSLGDPASSSAGSEFVAELIPRNPAPGDEFRLLLSPASGASDELGEEEIGSGEITVEFSMPGMDMGEHLMQLEPTAEGTLEGRIALPSCPMGHSLWQASVRVGQQPVADLVLHVSLKAQRGAQANAGPESDARRPSDAKQ